MDEICLAWGHKSDHRVTLNEVVFEAGPTKEGGATALANRQALKRENDQKQLVQVEMAVVMEMMERILIGRPTVAATTSLLMTRKQRRRTRSTAMEGVGVEVLHTI